MKVEKLAAIYIIVLAMAAFACALFPTFMARFVNLFLPTKTDFMYIWHIRYRMALFISGSLMLPVLIPYIAMVGFHGTNIRGVMRLSWIKTMFLVFLLPLLWIGLPWVGLCGKCWASNDYFYFYFFLVFGIFTGLQIYVQIFLLKMGIAARKIKRSLTFKMEFNK